MKWRFGIVGTGQIARINVDALLRTGRAEVAALCNRTWEKARAFARDFHLDVPIDTDCAAMLRRGNLDAVLICTPHGQHMEQFIACAERGLHVLIEKPLATTAEECDRMITAAEKNQIRSAVCHTQRYLPEIRLARETIQARKAMLGRLRHVTDRIDIHYFHEKRPRWFFDPAQAGGGLLLTHGAHQLDRLQVLTGLNAAPLCAGMEALPGYPGVDSGYQMIARAGDVTFLISCGGYRVPHTSDIRLDFENGSVAVSLFDDGMKGKGVWLGDETGFRKLDNPYAADDPYLVQFESLLDAVEGKPGGAPTLREARAVVWALDEARRRCPADSNTGGTAQ